jgi:hypothetical protein
MEVFAPATYSLEITMIDGLTILILVGLYASAILIEVRSRRTR